jgi:hypothetical protein
LTTATHDSASIVQRIRSAIDTRDFTILAPVLADDVRLGSCFGQPQVIDHLTRTFRSGLTFELIETESHADRVIAILDMQSSNPEQAFFGVGRQFAIAFVRDNAIVELQVAADRGEALAAEPSPPPPPRPAVPTVLRSIAAVLPVRDLASALEHYRRLGFRVREYEGGGYGYAERDGIHLHFNAFVELNRDTTTSTVYLYVADADLLYAEWRSAGVSGQFFEPRNMSYGLREGAHIDRDGNVLRFGSRLAP